MQAINPWVAALSIGLLISSSLVQVNAAPEDDRQYPQGQQQTGRGNPGQPPARQPTPGQGQAGTPQNAPGTAQQRPQQGPALASQTPQQQTQPQRPPQDFAQVQQAFHERRGQIGRGPALPPDVQIRQGQPLPHGYGKRLDAHALDGLPHYPGYEWRRVGSDMVLIAVTSGIVYTILQGVLN